MFKKIVATWILMTAVFGGLNIIKINRSLRRDLKAFNVRDERKNLELALLDTILHTYKTREASWMVQSTEADYVMGAVAYAYDRHEALTETGEI